MKQQAMLKMPAVLALIFGFATAGLFAGAVNAADAGALKPLPPEMKAKAEQFLPGVVGEAVPSFTIDPALANLSPGTRTYRIISGDDEGEVQQHQISQSSKPGAWRYVIDKNTYFMQESPGKSLVVVSESDGDQGVLTRYNPPMPLLITGMEAGDEKKVKLKINVYDLDDPSDLEHEGTLDLTITYIGAYKVTVPAGTFDAAAMRWHFKGKIGPATVEDTAVRFVANDVGMVAAAEQKDIAAFLIYNDDSKIGKVLETR
jgi:hypothetical protein